ncbi:MAG: hypothetical protein FWH18_04260 [Marinilabiliaceae bacterium]|nr:hypothetical protein [Marinilabiliaceae bacterium]
MKILLKVLLIIVSFSLFSCKPKRAIATQEIVPKRDKIAEIIDFAAQSWDSISKKIPSGMEETFGFNDLEEIKNSSFGMPIRMYYWQNNEMIESYTFRVPIIVNEKMVSLLTVSAENEMTTGDFGASLLAQNIQLISDYYNVTIIGILRVHSITTDFLIFEDINISYFIPVLPSVLQNLSQRNILTIKDISTIIPNDQ